MFFAGRVVGEGGGRDDQSLSQVSLVLVCFLAQRDSRGTCEGVPAALTQGGSSGPLCSASGQQTLPFSQREPWEGGQGRGVGHD